MKFARLTAIPSSASLWLFLIGDVFAQSATDDANKGGTNGALPDAGTSELTYLLFVVGAILFVVGTLKLISSYRE